MSFELMERNKRKVRQAEEEMHFYDVENAVDSATPNSSLLAVLAYHELQRTRLENAEAEVAELKSQAEKLSKTARDRIRNLEERLDRLQRERCPHKTKNIELTDGKIIEIDNPPPGVDRVVYVPNEILKKYVRSET